MTRVVIIGAGSQFRGKLSRDILAFPALQDRTTIALCDTDPEKLARVTRYVQRIVDGHPLPTRLGFPFFTAHSAIERNTIPGSPSRSSP